MKLRQLVSGIASGYVSRLVQLVVSLLLVPFLLRDDVLGIEGYGRVFTIVAIVAFLPLFTEGLAFSFARNISRALDDSEQEPRVNEVVGAGLKVLGSACAAAVAILLAISPVLLPLVGLETSPDVVAGLALSALLYWFENAFQLVRVPLLARGAIALVNGLGAAESLLRALAYLVVFSLRPASLASYFGIQLLFTILRGLAQAVALASRWPKDIRGWLGVPWTAGRSSIVESWPIAIQVGCDVLALRLPIVFVNRVLGAEASGLAALAINTIRYYVLQSLFSVLQPIAVPLASRVDPRRLSPHRRELLWRVEAVYVFTIGLAVTSVIAWMPDLIRLWLGPSYDEFAQPAQAMLLVVGIEMAFNARLSMLIGQNLLRYAIPGLLFGVFVSLCSTALAVWGWGSWELAVFGAALYFPIAYKLGVDTAFRRRLMIEADTQSRSRPLLFLIAGGAAAWAISPQSPGGGVFAGAARVAGNAAALTVLAHFLLLPLSLGFDTLRSLLRSLDRSVLTQMHDPGPPL